VLDSVVACNRVTSEWIDRDLSGGIDYDTPRGYYRDGEEWDSDTA
jgi:hypothetical protein